MSGGPCGQQDSSTIHYYFRKLPCPSTIHPGWHLLATSVLSDRALR
jgi:hypothetical protein